MRLFRTGSENLTENLTASLTESLTENLAAPRGRHQRPPARKLLDAGPFCAHRYSSAAGPPAGLRLVRRAPRAPAPWMTDSGASGTRPGRPSVSGAPTARPAMAMPDAPRAPVGARAVCRSGRSHTCPHRTPGGPGTRPSGRSHEVAEPAASGDGVRRPGSGPAAGRPGPFHRCPCPAARCAPRGGTAAPPASRLPPLGHARSASRSSGHASGRAGRYPRVRRPARARPWAAADGGSAPQHYFVSVLETAVRAHRISHGSHSPTGLDGLKHPPTRIRVETPTDRSENKTNASPPPEELMVIHECVGVAGGG